MKKPLLIAAIICFALFALTLKYGWGATYYVCSDGNGAGDTAGSNWANCMDGFDDLGSPSAGDIFYLRDDDGIYRELMDLWASGSNGSPITFAADTGEVPVISGADIIETWADETGNIWSASLATAPERVFFDGTFGTKAATYAALDADQEWYYCDGCGDGTDNTLYQYVGSDEDPDTLYTTPGTEASVRNDGIFGYNLSYITISGITVTNTNQQGISFYTDNNVEQTDIIIDSCTVSYSDIAGIALSAATDADSIVNSTVSNNTTFRNGSGIYLTRVFTSSIYGNTAYENGETYGHAISEEYGIGLSGVSTSFVYENTIYDNEGIGIHLWGGETTWPVSNNTEIYNNTVYGNATDPTYIAAAFGIYIESAGANGDDICEGSKVYNNLVYDNLVGGIKVEATDFELYNNIIYGNLTWAGIWIEANTSDGGSLIANNTVYNNDIIGVWLNNNPTTVTMRNNIIFNNGTAYGEEIRDDDGSASMTHSNNLLWDDSSNGDDHLIQWNGSDYGTGGGTEDITAWESTGIWADPLFTDMTNDLFTLTSASPAIGAGTDVSLTTDYNGAPVCGTPSIGAYDVCTDITSGSATITLGTGGSATLR